MDYEHDREFRYRQLFGLTHEQYLDEPHETVEMLLRIGLIREGLKNKGASDG